MRRVPWVYLPCCLGLALALGAILVGCQGLGRTKLASVDGTLMRMDPVYAALTAELNEGESLWVQVNRNEVVIWGPPRLRSMLEGIQKSSER